MPGEYQTFTRLVFNVYFNTMITLFLGWRPSLLGWRPLREIRRTLPVQTCLVLVVVFVAGLPPYGLQRSSLPFFIFPRAWIR